MLILNFIFRQASLQNILLGQHLRSKTMANKTAGQELICLESPSRIKIIKPKRCLER